jgi:hypothetical protein
LRRPGKKSRGNAAIKETIGEAENEGKDAFGQAILARPPDNTAPQVRLVLMNLDASGNFQQPGKANPGAEGVAEEMENLHEELVL